MISARLMSMPGPTGRKDRRQPSGPLGPTDPRRAEQDPPVPLAHGAKQLSPIDPRRAK
jgi:hypothetical protein